MNSKKGMAMWSIILFGILALVMLVVVAGGGTDMIKKVFGGGGSLIEDNVVNYDCDSDKVPNTNDKCPCLNYGTKQSNDLPGCPSGTLEKAAIEDQQTCFKYVSGSTFSDKCTETDSSKCVKRCSQVSAGTSGTTVTAGTKCNCDLIVENLKVGLKGSTLEKKTTFTHDSKTPYAFVLLDISFDIKNQGKELTPAMFKAKVQVCDNSKTTCKDLKEFTYGALDSGKKVSQSFSFTLGKNDACDGKGEQGCYVQVVVDSSEALGEINGEKNNKDSFGVLLKGKKSLYAESVFTKYSSIEIFGGDDMGPNVGTKKTIRQICSGFVGTDSSCRSEDDDCNGKFPAKLATKGCRVFASEDDNEGNDCAWSDAISGQILSHTEHKAISRSSSISYDKPDAKNLFEWEWKATDAGSLLCNNNYWYLCNTKGYDDNKILEVGTGSSKFKYQCNSGYWSKLT